MPEQQRATRIPTVHSSSFTASEKLVFFKAVSFVSRPLGSLRRGFSRERDQNPLGSRDRHRKRRFTREPGCRAETPNRGSPRAYTGNRWDKNGNSFPKREKDTADRRGWGRTPSSPETTRPGESAGFPPAKRRTSPHHRRSPEHFSQESREDNRSTFHSTGIRETRSKPSANKTCRMSVVDTRQAESPRHFDEAIATIQSPFLRQRKQVTKCLSENTFTPAPANRAALPFAHGDAHAGYSVGGIHKEQPHQPSLDLSAGAEDEVELPSASQAKRSGKGKRHALY